jgi:two-component system, sensor histidine kinase LadS
MHHRYLCLLATVLSLLVSTIVSANDTRPLDTHKNYEAIGDHLSYFVEIDHELSLDEARAAYAENRFTQSGNEVLAFGIGSNPVWLHFTVENTGEQSTLRRLVLENSWLDQAKLYFLFENEIVHTATAGDQLPFTARTLPHRFLVFDHEYAPGITDIFLRAQSPDAIVLPIFFGDINTSNDRDIFNGYSYGLLYGIVIGLLFYNLFLYLSIRQKRYFFFVIYLASFLLMNVSYTGHGYQAFWPTNVWLQQWMNPVSISIVATIGIIFAFSFLKIRKLSPTIFIRTCYFIASFWVIQLCFILFGLQSLSNIIAISFVTMFSIFTFYCAVIVYRRGHTDAIYYLIATSATLIGAVITALTVTSFIPYTNLTYRAVELAVSIDVILLSVALTEQFRRMEKEKNEALQLARIDMLTNLKNRREFEEVSNTIWHNAIRHKHETSVIMLDLDNFKQINDTYGHASGDDVLKEIAAVLNTMVREGDVLARWGGEEFIILLPQTSLYEAAKIAERIRARISELTIKTRLHNLRTTASIGVAQNNDSIVDIDDLIRLADKGLYQAKRRGRNNVCAN